MEIEGQLTLNDLMSENIPLGWINKAKAGNVIPFQKLKDYIGKKVICQTGSGNGETVNKVVIITDYYNNLDTYYSCDENDNTVYMNDYVYSLSSKETKDKYKPAFKCDRIAYSDDDRTKKTNSWLSEVFCSCGRHNIYHNNSQICFYELNAI